MAKGKRSRRVHKKNSSAFMTLFIVALVLILALSSGGDFTSALEDIWQGTFQFSDNQKRDAAAELAQVEQSDGKLVLYVMDTGNSDSMLLRLPQGQSILIDAADDDDFMHISAVLDAFSIDRLSAAVATHPDADHIGSMDEVVRDYEPEVLYMPEIKKNTRTYELMIQEIEKNNTYVVNPLSGQDISMGEVRITVLNPSDKEYEEPNEASIVLLVEYGKTKFLFTGDIEEGSLQEILEQHRELLDVDVLKIAHHGSAASTTQEFLSATTPEIAVITSGKDNDYGHPHKETTDLLDQNNIKTLRTDQKSDIVICSDGEKLEYRTAA